MQIFVHHNEQRLGPYSVEAVRDMLARGRITGSDLAWHDGLSDWKPLSDLPEVTAAAPPPLDAPPPLPQASPYAPPDAALTGARYSAATDSPQTQEEWQDHMDREYGPVVMVASHGQRLANLIIDYIAFIVFSFFIGLFLGLIGLFGLIESMNDTVLGLILMTSYYVLMEAAFGKTVGKFVTKTKVVTKDGDKPSFLAIVGRTFSRFIPFEPFSFLGEPVGWHDSLSGTRVVKD